MDAACGTGFEPNLPRARHLGGEFRLPLPMRSDPDTCPGGERSVCQLSGEGGGRGLPAIPMRTGPCARATVDANSAPIWLPQASPRLDAPDVGGC